MFRDIYILYKILLLSTIFLWSSDLFAQQGKKHIRQGNREYEKSKFSESEIHYRKAIDKNQKSPEAVFNIGDALYKQEKFEDAGKQFIENINQNEDKEKKSAAYYNLGNSLLKANKPEESIEAYKEALKLNPENFEAKYNLAYAQDMLKQQQQQQQQQQQNDQKDQQNKDKQDQNNQNQENKENQDQHNQQNQQQQQEEQQGMSKEDAERLLNAIANDERDVQEKVKLEKAAKTKVRTLKNW